MMNTVTSALRDQPLIAVDVVPVSFSVVAGLQIGTAARAFAPFAGRQALPGVLLTAGERLEGAALRALATKAGVLPPQVHEIQQLRTFDGPSRDPRSSAISVAFFAVVEPGSGKATDWSPFNEHMSLPFDHDVIVAAARKLLQDGLWHDVPLTRALTGSTFNTSLAAALTTAVTGEKPHAGNLHRMLVNHAGLGRMETTSVAGRGRPATAWRWDA
jgi:8-oxo-dGTP diphosphatase